jgi:hypothetical protein
VSFEGFTEIWLQIVVFWVGAQGSGGPKKSKEQNIFIVVSKVV